VALDREDLGEVVELAQELSSCKGEFGFKLNLDFFVNSRKDSHYFNGGIKSQELEGSAKKAVEMGHKMRKLSGEEALKMGAPEGKIKEGIVYWAKIT